MEVVDRDVSRGAIAAVESLADNAARWVADEMYGRHAQVLAMRGTKGRLHTEQDVKYHIEFLCGALATGAPVFFTDYVRWLATVLESRGVPTQMLDGSLELLRRFYDRSLDPSLATQVADVLDQGRFALVDAREPDQSLYCAHRPPDLPQVGDLTRCLIDGDVESASSFSQQAWECSGDYLELATCLFQPALYDIGTLWQRNEITVAQEHLATAITQTLLTQFYLDVAGCAEPSERTVLFAGIEGNQHVMGLRMVSDAFELAGWSVRYLGANTPTDALVADVDRVRPEFIGLSASLVQQLPALQHAVNVMKAELGSRCPIILVGGLPTNQFDKVWRWIGADAWYPNASMAVEGFAQS